MAASVAFLVLETCIQSDRNSGHHHGESDHYEYIAVDCNSANSVVVRMARAASMIQLSPALELPRLFRFNFWLSLLA